MIPQIERFAHKYAFSKLSINIFNTVIAMMIDRADQSTGNKFLFIVNDRAFMLVNQVLGHYLADFKTDGTFMYSKAANGYVDVGATFQSYEFMGNQISFRVDKTITREYGYDKAFMICLDLTADTVGGEPPIQMFTLKNGDFITNRFVGVGGIDGLSSGEVSSPVAGSKIINWGYSGVGVFNPYRSFILREI